MKFKSVTIKNFRNFEDISIELTNKVSAKLYSVPKKDD